MTIVKFTPSNGNPPGKLADAELHWTPNQLHGECPTCHSYGSSCSCEPLAGLKLIGFAVWERRSGSGRNVTFPARQYAVNGERRSFALLRPANADEYSLEAQNRIRDLILNAYAKEYDQVEQPAKQDEVPPGTSRLAF